MIVTQTRQKHALYKLKVGVKHYSFWPSMHILDRDPQLAPPSYLVPEPLLGIVLLQET